MTLGKTLPELPAPENNVVMWLWLLDRAFPSENTFFLGYNTDFFFQDILKNLDPSYL